MKIAVSLPKWMGVPKDRLDPGTLNVIDAVGNPLAGPFSIYGKSDNEAARAAGNPKRNPEQKFGDTPAGEFMAKLAYEVDTPANRRSYGQPDDTRSIPVILLRPLQGDFQAWRRQLNEGLAVKMGLMFHAGDPRATGGLRPTHGCGRVKQADMTAIITPIKKLGAGVEFPVTIAEVA